MSEMSDFRDLDLDEFGRTPLARELDRKHEAKTLRVTVHAGRFEESQWVSDLDELKPGRYEVPLQGAWNVKVWIEVKPEAEGQQ